MCWSRADVADFSASFRPVVPRITRHEWTVSRVLFRGPCGAPFEDHSSRLAVTDELERSNPDAVQQCA